jgi:hypothetical protein
MDTEKNKKLINWHAILYKENIKSVLLIVLFMIVLFLFFNQREPYNLETHTLDSLLLANMSYYGQLENLEGKIDQTQSYIYQKINDLDADSSMLINLKKEIEDLEKYQKEIEDLKETRSILKNSINIDDAPYITFADSTTTYLTISQNEMVILLRFLFGLTENIRDDRFEIKEISDLKNEYSEIILLDKSLGTTWMLNKNKNKFDNIKIENLSRERRNKEIDNLIEIIIKRTSGKKIDPTLKH